MAATDRYRLAVRELTWQPTSALELQVLVPARALSDAAKSLAGQQDLAIALFREVGIPTGDNEPYSGRALNATLNRHGEANGIPSIAIDTGSPWPTTK